MWHGWQWTCKFIYLFWIVSGPAYWTTINAKQPRTPTNILLPEAINQSTNLLSAAKAGKQKYKGRQEIKYQSRIKGKNLGNPIRKLLGIRNCCWEEYKSWVLWSHNNAFLPNNTSFPVTHVMHFIKYYPSNLPGDFRPLVLHTTPNFCGHNLKIWL